jgi:Spy/CpxP family protein refolding chaperone
VQNTDPKKQGVSKKNLEQLDLSKDQEKQIDDIQLNARQEKEKINNDRTLTPEQKKEKIKAIDKGSKNKIKAVLTPEQKQRMKEQKVNDKKKTK